jgi:hypothetical protein
MVPERAAGPAGAEGQHQVINGQHIAGEEGVHHVTVGSIHHGRPHGASETTCRGREPIGIPPGDHHA